MSPDQVFPVRLRTAREALGLSQSALAHRVGLRAKSVVSEMEHGRNFPRLATLARLAHALEVSTDWLLGLTDTPGTVVWGALAWHAGQLSASNLAWYVGLGKELVLAQEEMPARLLRGQVPFWKEQ